MHRIGIDVGGTFTDFTLLDEQSGRVSFHKLASTPQEPSDAIEPGIRASRDAAVRPETELVRSLLVHPVYASRRYRPVLIV